MDESESQLRGAFRSGSDAPAKWRMDCMSARYPRLQPKNPAISVVVFRARVHTTNSSYRTIQHATVDIDRSPRTRNPDGRGPRVAVSRIQRCSHGEQPRSAIAKRGAS